MKIINKKYFEFEIQFRSWYLLGLGLSMGCNHFTRNRNKKDWTRFPNKINRIPQNFFAEIDILFWTIGFEIKGY